MNRLERHLKSDVGYVRGDEKRVSGCGKPACGRHYHALLASAAPLQPAFVEWLWNDVARNPSDDGGAKVELRDEFLNGEIFYSLKEAQILTERWRVEYNTERPHSALGYRPPAPQAILPKQQGHGDMENAPRFPHPHTPGGDYGQRSKMIDSVGIRSYLAMRFLPGLILQSNVPPRAGMRGLNRLLKPPLHPKWRARSPPGADTGR
jgi:hypothetical protein